MINLIPAHAITFDFPIAVLLLLAALHSTTLIFVISFCWQTMVRAKKKMKTNRTRVRTVNGTTVTTRFIPSTAMPQTTRLRNLEKQILDNLGTIQRFNMYNNSDGPLSTAHAFYQRQRYQITSIRENCDLTTQKVQHALSMSDDESSTAHAYHGISLTLKTMLRNEITRTETIYIVRIHNTNQYTECTDCKCRVRVRIIRVL